MQSIGSTCAALAMLLPFDMGYPWPAMLSIQLYRKNLHWCAQPTVQGVFSLIPHSSCGHWFPSVTSGCCIQCLSTTMIHPLSNCVLGERAVQAGTQGCNVPQPGIFQQWVVYLGAGRAFLPKARVLTVLVMLLDRVGEEKAVAAGLICSLL